MPRARASEDEPTKALPSGPEPEAAKGNGVDEISIPSPDAGDGLDEFARYAVQDVVTTQAGQAVTCAVGPPNKLHFFRTHQDPSLYRVLHFLVVETDNKKRTYLVNGALVDLPEFEGRTKVARTAPWINEHGGLGIWLPSIQHDENSWVRSALILIEEAKTRWVAAIPVKKVGAYTLLPSKRDRGEPDWPALSFSHWMKLAFPQDMRIDDRDHPIAKVLRGE
jgi:hypothetical protein